MPHAKEPRRNQEASPAVPEDPTDPPRLDRATETDGPMEPAPENQPGDGWVEV